MPTPDQPTPPLHASPHDGQLVGAGGQGKLATVRRLREEPTLVVESVRGERVRRIMLIAEKSGGDLLITSLEDGGHLCVAAADRSLLAQAILQLGKPGVSGKAAAEPASAASVMSLLQTINQQLAQQGRDLAISADRPGVAAPGDANPEGRV